MRFAEAEWGPLELPTLRMLASLAIPTTDVAPAFLGMTDTQLHSYPADNHPGPEAHRRMASVIGNALRSHRMLPRADRAQAP